MGLADNHLLVGLPSAVIERVRNLCEIKKYKQNELVAAREDEGRSVFLVLSGTYSVETRVTNEQELRFADISENEFFGEMAAIDRLPRSADVRCRIEGEVAELKAESFEQLLLTEPQITLRLLKLFTNRLRQSNQRLQDFSTTPPNERVIQQIIRLVRPSPDQTGQWIISPTPKHDEIAAWTGTSKEFVSSILGKLIHEHIIVRKNKDMIVLDLYSLKNLASN
jgi:CRP/FNR family cyclic AMP-dependent transcriptional regulator